MKITDEMVQAAFAAYVSAKNKPTGWGETYGRWMRAALEAALAAAPQPVPAERIDPVAWYDPHTGDVVGVDVYRETCTEPLYTHPPAPDNKLREAARMALEALVWEAGSEPGLYAAQTHQAIDALREVLGG